jgi:hypothetical protein
VAWVLFVTVLFCLPQTRPAHHLVTVSSFNYAPIALVVVLLLASVWWVVAGRRDYESPALADDAELAEYAEGVV